jgi:hypothetical protein
MPYSPDSPPEVVRHLPKNKQRQWVEVWNSCHKKGQPEKQCFQTAWGVVKKSSENELFSPAESEGSIGDATLNRDILNGSEAVRELLSIARELNKGE